MPPRCTQALRNFKCRPDDVFLVTYPKSGTMWMEQVMLLVHFDGDVTKGQSGHVMEMFPFLDRVVDMDNIETSQTKIEIAEKMPSPRFLSSHMPVDLLPEAIRSDDPEVKVIYVARNPKDVSVSFYHFCHYLKYMPSYESWDVFFEEFIAGRAPQGSWFENVLPWWRRRNHPNVLFLKYEDMKKDLGAVVRQVAEFMGKGSLPADIVDEIVSQCSFSAMKMNPSSNPDFSLGIQNGNNRSFMRKGLVGDWKSLFTEEQNKRFDDVYRRELGGSGLEFEFEPSL